MRDMAGWNGSWVRTEEAPASLVEFGPLDLAGVLHVCQHMRAVDRWEILNQLPIGTTSEGIAMLTMRSDFGWVCRRRGVPVAVAQYAKLLEGTWRAGLFGTDDFPKVAPAIMREFRQRTIPFLIDDLKLRYCEAYSDVDHLEAHKMLNFLGFEKRATLDDYGSHGRQVALFTATAREIERCVSEAKENRRRSATPPR